MNTTTLGPGTIKALKILESTDFKTPISAQCFAQKMWPDSLMHQKRSRGGNGTQIGKAAWLAGGSFLAKLISKGLVFKNLTSDSNGSGYYISSKGKFALNPEQK